MNKLVYVGVAVIVIIGAFVLLGGSGSSGQNNGGSNSGRLTTVYPNVTNPYNTTTTVLPSNSSVNNSAPTGCTASKYYSCSNLGFGPALLSVTIGQNTGTYWSSYGVGYAPVGTTLSGGIPQITFYTANYSSSSNVGANLTSGGIAKIHIPFSGSVHKGTLWVCYVNSGILYVGNGCTTNGGVPATYVQIATVNAP